MMMSHAGVLRGPRVVVTEYDRDIMTRTVWAEARHDDIFGQRSVAWVIVNRARDVRGRFPSSIAAVCKQRGQFHAWSAAGHTDGRRSAAVSLRKHQTEYIAARMIVDGVLAGAIPDPTDGAQFYYAQSEGVSPLMPSWASHMDCSTQSRLHVFCRPLL